MTNPIENAPPAPAHGPQRGRRLLMFLGAVVLLYLLAAYVVIPQAWKRNVRRHPELFDAPRITHTHDGIPLLVRYQVEAGAQHGQLRPLSFVRYVRGFARTA